MFGFSIYKQDYSHQYIQKMIDIGVTNAFISLHVTEELGSKQELINFLTDLQKYNLQLITDVSPVTFTIFNKHELKQFNINTLRIDYGITLDQIIELQKDFEIVLNASTLQPTEVEYLKQNGADLSAITLMHNFYPKEETGLSYEMFLEINNRYRQYGFKILSFVPGDAKLRGPVYAGLPMIEEHRSQPFIVNCAQIIEQSNQIFIADIELSDANIANLKLLNQGIIPVPIISRSLEDKFINTPLKIRVDSNHLNIRIEDSRFNLKTTEPIQPENTIERYRGSITFDNQLAGRYNGEIMISRTDLPANPKLNVVANIDPLYINLIKYDLRKYKLQLIPM